MNTATLTPPTYIPRTGTLAERVLAYFRQNPFAELRPADVARIFEVPSNSIQAGLTAAVDNGALVYELNEDLKYTYTLGVNQGARPAGKAKAKEAAAAKAPATPAPTPAPAPAPLPAPTGWAPDQLKEQPKPAAPATGPGLDLIAELTVEEGIPLDTSGNRAGTSKWQPLFDKLTKPDTSIAFPRQWKSAVAADATKRNAKAKTTQGLPTYRVAYISATQARIWRVA